MSVATQYKTIELAKISPNKNQPRKYFNEESLNELASNIKKHGLLQPLLVRPKGDGYELVLGERRYRACKLKNVTWVTCEIQTLSDEEALELSLSENLQREDLTPIEEALSYKHYLDLGYTQQQTAAKVDKSRSRIAQMLSLLNLSPHIQNLMGRSEMSERHGRELLKLEKICNKYEEPDVIGYGISNVLIKIWDHDHTISFAEAMEMLENGDLGKDKAKIISIACAVLIGVNHIPDHVATRISEIGISVRELEKLVECVRFDILWQRSHNELKIELDDLYWFAATWIKRTTNDQGRCYGWSESAWNEGEDGYYYQCTGRMEVQRYVPALKAKAWFCRNCAKTLDKDDGRGGENQA